MTTSAYKLKTFTGSSHQRSSRVLIETPYGLPSTATFVEEMIQEETAGENIVAISHKAVDSLTAVIDPNQDITLIDPVTNEPTKDKYKAALLLDLLNAFYLQQAKARDSLAKVIADQNNKVDLPGK